MHCPGNTLRASPKRVMGWLKVPSVYSQPSEAEGGAKDAYDKKGKWHVSEALQRNMQQMRALTMLLNTLFRNMLTRKHGGGETWFVCWDPEQWTGGHLNGSLGKEEGGKRCNKLTFLWG